MSRDSASFEAFFREHFPQVARASALVMGDLDSGREIAQESFARLVPRWDDMESDEHARNYVFKIALNLARSQLRSPWRLVGLGAHQSESLGTESDMEKRTADRMLIAEVLRLLKPKQRAIIVLVDYLGYEPTAAAEILGMKPGTVRVYLMRGRQVMRSRLAGERSDG